MCLVYSRSCGNSFFPFPYCPFRTIQHMTSVRLPVFSPEAIIISLRHVFQTCPLYVKSSPWKQSMCLLQRGRFSWENYLSLSLTSGSGQVALPPGLTGFWLSQLLRIPSDACGSLGRKGDYSQDASVRQKMEWGCGKGQGYLQPHPLLISDQKS